MVLRDHGVEGRSAPHGQGDGRPRVGELSVAHEAIVGLRPFGQLWRGLFPSTKDASSHHSSRLETRGIDRVHDGPTIGAITGAAGQPHPFRRMKWLIPIRTLESIPAQEPGFGREQIR